LTLHLRRPQRVRAGERGARIVVAVIISIGMLAAFVPGAAASRAGGSLTYGLEAETTGGWCIPRASLAVSGITVASAIYDTLTVLNRDGDYVP